MIANTLLGFNNDPTIKNFESINATLIKIYKLDEKDSKAEEGQRRHEKQQEKKKVQKEKRNEGDSPIRALLNDKKKKGKLGDKVKKMFGMLKDGLGGMLKTIGPLLSSLGAILTSAIFLKIVAILAIGAVIITFIKSQKFRDWVNKHVIDPVAKVFTEELPKAFAKVFGFGGGEGSTPAPSTDTPDSETPESDTPIKGGIDVLIPLDHAKTPTAVPDTPDGDTYKNASATGADGREREHQDNAARKLKASLAKKGIKAKIVTPEEHGDYQSYDKFLKSESEKGVRIVPLHFDAARSGGGTGFLTRTRAGDKGDASFAAPIQQALADFQKNNTNLGDIRSGDTAKNATVNMGAASPTALVELGVMVDWEKHHGKNFTESDKFQVLIDSVADGIEKGGNFEKKQKGGTIGPSETKVINKLITQQQETPPQQQKQQGFRMGTPKHQKSSSPQKKPTPIHRMTGGPIMSAPSVPTKKQSKGGFKMPQINLPKFGGFKMPSFGSSKKGGVTSQGTQHTPSMSAPQAKQMMSQGMTPDSFSQIVQLQGSRAKPQQSLKRPKLNRGGMVPTRNQATTRLSEASNNTMMNGKRSRTIIVIPPTPAAPPPMPAPSGGGGMIIQNTQTRIQMKSQMNRINRGAIA